MFILLLIYLIFLFVYVIFSIYSILRIWSLRLKGDKSGVLVLAYLITVVLVTVISLLFIVNLSWKTNFNFLPGGING